MARRIANYKISVTPFDAFRLRKAECIWFNDSSDLISFNKPLDRKEMLAEISRRFGYAIPGAPILKRENFDLECRVTMHAEAYGVQHNGGGARAGNLQGVQLKGIGCNAYLGANADEKHNYGVLYFDQAIAESIQTLLCKAILPHGAVDVYGVISTGVTIDFAGSREPIWNDGKPAAILMRQPCLRPAHYLRARGFEPRQKRPPVLSDATRVSVVQRRIAELGRDHSAFERLVSNFLQKSANQFAVARANRLMHSVFTPSNISLDGRWLDLTSAAIIDTGTNPRSSALNFSFQEEAFVVPQIARELIYTYNKYNLAAIELMGCFEKYRHQWSMSYLEEITRLVGISAEARCGVNIGLIRLMRLVAGIIDGKPVPFRMASLEARLDKFEVLLLALYSPLIKSGDHVCFDEHHHELKQKLFEHYNQERDYFGSWQIFVRAKFLAAYRRCAFLKFFCGQNVYGSVRGRDWSVVDSNFAFFDGIKNIIQTSVATDDIAETKIFNLNGIALSYRHKCGKLYVNHGRADAIRFVEPSEAVSYIDSMPPSRFEFGDYKFIGPIRRMLHELVIHQNQ